MRGALDYVRVMLFWRRLERDCGDNAALGEDSLGIGLRGGEARKSATVDTVHGGFLSERWIAQNELAREIEGNEGEGDA
jgi:hypothetical protein